MSKAFRRRAPEINQHVISPRGLITMPLYTGYLNNGWSLSINMEPCFQFPVRIPNLNNKTCYMFLFLC